MDCFNFWKFDKIDKIGISLIFIVFAIYSTFSCFATEIEDVEPINIRLGFSSLTVGSNGEFVEGSSVLNYFYIEPGYHYTITNNSSFQSVIVSSSEVPSVGVSYYVNTILNSGRTYDFDSSTYSYMYFTQGSGLSITREKLEGMTGSVDLLSSDVGFNIFNSFIDSLGFVLPVVLTCFGIWIISVFIRRFSKGV